jgi:hypothetical protein
MKKSVLFGVLIVFLILNASLIIAASNQTDDLAYDCLRDKVQGNCDSLSLEEKIFSLLAIGECKDEITFDSGYSDLKSTAQAILALSEVNEDTTEAEEWLLSNSIDENEIDWLLQIEAEATTCTITSDALTSPVTININADKTLSGDGGCLQNYEDYWMQITPACYNSELTISCNEDFSTNLLYKKETGNKIYILPDTHIGSGGGQTNEKVESLCFSQDGTDCNYEASLWSAITLHSLKYEKAPYIPYLITMADENQEFLPEAFLCMLTGDFCNDILSNQLTDGHWDVSGNKYYDTALALLPFQDDKNEQKTKTITWLTGLQKSDGCWDTTPTNIAFLLYSIWPKTIIADDETDCDDFGYCMSEFKCQEIEGADLGNEYNCFGATNICCDREAILETCSEQNGEDCISGERCSSSTIEASDTSECCLGTCQEISDETECEENYGICRSSSCYSGEEESTDDCESEDVCCIEEEPTESKNYLWVWILLILIVLIVLGIIFRDKLRPVWFKIKSKFKKKRGPRGRQGFPPMTPGRPPQRVQRRILPPQGGGRPPVRRPTQGKPKKDMDDVLKKLRDMGK